MNTDLMNCSIKREKEDQIIENTKDLLSRPKIPRPPNAFMLYANENRKLMAQQFPADSNKEISKKLGSTWKNLDSEKKNKYFEKARLIDIEHKRKYPNYVYNPKEARIRKAMREATRDRSIGASPMLPRPSARRAAPHGWVNTQHEDQLMMSPLSVGMRGPGLDSPCFPISNAGTGSNQFMTTPMNAGYARLESPLPPPTPQPTPNASMHGSYIQPNPLTQLQQQTEMWHSFQDDLRPRSSGNPYMMQEVQPSYHHQPSPPHSIPSPLMMDQHRQTPHSLHSMNAASISMTPSHSNSNMSMTPPHSNENVPPDEHFYAHQQAASDLVNEQSFESKHLAEAMQPLMESSNVQHQQQQLQCGNYSSVYGQTNQVTQQPNLEKPEDLKMKKIPDNTHMCPKNPSCKNTLYLPLSCTNFCASPDLFTNNLEYQRKYIAEYFQNFSDYEILNFVAEDGGTFPYASIANFTENKFVLDDSPQPNFIQTDVGYIPIMFDNSTSIYLGKSKCKVPS